MTPKEQEEAKALRQQIEELEHKLLLLHTKAFCREITRR